MGVYVDNSANFIRQVAMCSYSPPHKFFQLDTNVLESDQWEQNESIVVLIKSINKATNLTLDSSH